MLSLHHPGEAPPGFEWVTRRETELWRVMGVPRPCQEVPGWRKKPCGRSGIAEQNRGLPGRNDVWVALCPMHMQGRWVQDGAVWVWGLREAQGFVL